LAGIFILANLINQNQAKGVQLYQDPSSCNGFYKCEEGIASAEVCATGLLFDETMALTDAIHNYCVYNWKADCGARKADNTPESSPGIILRNQHASKE
jgi:hypothetical protein